MYSNAKDAIKSRMIRNASGIWGYQDSEDINSFDPIVGMIIGALAEEIYNISGEIKKTDARIVEKLFELMINKDILVQTPSHSLARAKTTFPQVTLSESYRFDYIKKIPKTINDETVYSNKTICFTPTSDIKLVNGEVKYFAAANQLFEISDQVKELLAHADSRVVPDLSKLYIGLRLDNTIEKLDGLSILFSVKNKQKEERFYNSIINAKWKINNINVSFRQGFELKKHGGYNKLGEIFKKENDISFNSCNYINEFYRTKFMTVENKNYYLKDFVRSETYPEEFKKEYPASVLKSIPNDIFWIEIQLPQPVTTEIVNDLTILMNCFPVINRELNEISQVITRGINIIPLPTEDLFFDIRMITDSKGMEYKPLDSFSSENSELEGYIVRQGGVARFDSRDAKETINHLIDLIRDERAGFALLGTDLIASELKQLDQIVARLKQRLEASNISDESNSYLLLYCSSNYERVTIQFWTTCGELANNIRPNSRLTVYHGSDLDSNSAITITNSFGGKQKLSKEDKLNRLRRTLLSKGRVVTNEDIEELCFEHFGTDLSDINIKKGVRIDPSAVKGLIRSIDIYLTLNKQTKLTESELEQKTDELIIRLKKESTNLLPFRIFVSYKI